MEYEFTLPRRKNKGLKDIVVMVDESGSMHDVEVEAGFANLASLFDNGEIPLARTVVLHFSGYVDCIEVFEPGEVPIFERKTNGGTDFRAAFNEARELERKGIIDPCCWIMITDMYDSYPSPPEQPVLWLSTTPLGTLRDRLPDYGDIAWINTTPFWAREGLDNPYE